MVTCQGRWLGLGRGILALWLVVAGVQAQAVVGRAVHPGRVLDAVGAPVAGAAITFVSVEGHGPMRDEDVVAANSDANGRYRVQLLPTRSYLAWATQSTAVGALVTAAVPRSPLQTDLQFGTQAKVAPARLRIRGGEAWRERGLLRVQLVVAGSERLVPPATPDASGSVVIPPLPDMLCHLRVFCGDALVHQDDLTTRGPYQLPPPQRIPMRVRDARGKAVAGAAVERLSTFGEDHVGPFPPLLRGDRHVVAVTDAQGQAEVLVAATRPPSAGMGYPPLTFVASKPGFLEAVSGYGARPFENGERVASDLLSAVWRPKQGLRFSLQAAPPVLARLTALPGQLPTHVRIGGLEFVPYDADSMTSLWHSFVAPVAADGTFPLPAKRERSEPQVFELAAVLAPVADDDPFRRVVTPRPLVVPVGWATEPAGIDLRHLRALRLQLVDGGGGGGGGSAMRAKVLLVPKAAQGFLDPNLAMRAEADPTGRLVLPVLPGTWLVVALDGASFGWSVVEVAAKPDVQVLELKPLERMRVRVVDGDGKPIVGARFDNTGASWGGDGRSEQAFLTELGYSLACSFLQGAITDQDGRADIPFLPSKSLKVDFVAHHGARRGSEQVLVAGEEVAEIELK